jgi:hypothetical protein
MPSDLARWIKEGHLWNAEQKRAVHNLTFNYLSVILPHLDQHGKKSALNKIAENWEKALTNLHIIPDMLLTISKVPVIQEVARSH